MRIIKAFIALMAFLIVACSGFDNPISSETDEQSNSQDDSIFISESGGSEHG